MLTKLDQDVQFDGKKYLSYDLLYQFIYRFIIDVLSKYTFHAKSH